MGCLALAVVEDINRFSQDPPVFNATSLVQPFFDRRRVTWSPATLGSVINRDTACHQHLLEFALADIVAAISKDGPDADLSLEGALCEIIAQDGMFFIWREPGHLPITSGRLSFFATEPWRPTSHSTIRCLIASQTLFIGR